MRARRTDMARGRALADVLRMPKPPETERAEPDTTTALPLAREALFRARTVLVFGEVTTELAARVTTELLALAATGDAPIRMLVHSQGGHVEAGDTIHDLVKAVAPDLVMIGTGWVASAGALIYAAAKKKNRFALPNTRFLLHQPLGGAGGPASDVEIEAAQILKMRDRLNRIFADATGRDAATVTRETERNLWMSAEEARDYGLVHRVIGRIDEASRG